jgi:hypothetical protein
MTSILKADNIQDADGNNIINENSNTITIGASGDTVDIPSGATLDATGATITGITQGITQADTFRLSSDLSMSSSGLTKITANLERDDTSGYGKIGTGMTNSSGDFSFPETGIYYIEASGTVFGNSISSDSNYQNVAIYTSTDSGSNYTHRANAPVALAAGSNYNNTITHCLFDVTDTSTHRVAFYQDCHQSGVQLKGNSSYNHTHFNFIRLGDT